MFYKKKKEPVLLLKYLILNAKVFTQSSES